MAVSVLKNAYISLGSASSAVLTDHVKSVKLDYSADMVDDTNMGDNTKQVIAGLKDWSVELELAQDWATGSIDDWLFPLVGASAFQILVRPTTAVVGVSNPNYSGNVVLEKYNPITGSAGDLAKTTVSFRPASDLIRSTA